MTDQPFDPEPRTQSEYLRAIWIRLGRVEEQAKTTNGRVSRLERLVLFSGGALVALGVSMFSPLLMPLLMGVVR